jgi:4-hydroxy-2-oxoheptanedioate aldolase
MDDADPTNPLARGWARGCAAVVGWLQIPAPLSAEALSRCGYDGLVIDLQHAPIDLSDAVAMMTAIELGGAVPLARIRTNEPAEVMALLDAGAYGIIAPMVNSAEDALRLAGALHYPPRGARSFGARRPLLRYGTRYAEIASRTIISFAMIETRSGLENLDAILAVDGIDGVFVGPSDLALALGSRPGVDSSDALVVDAIRHIRERAHAHGRRAGIFCAASRFAREKLAEGFDLVAVTPDLGLLVAAARAALDDVRAMSIT